MAMPPLRKIFKGSWAVPGNMLVKCEVRSFNRSGAIIDRYAAHRHTHTDTH